MSTKNMDPSPDWHELYRLAQVETDPALLRRRISEARNAILDRLQETLAKPSNYKERQQLSDALTGLRTLQQEYESRIQQFGERRKRPR